MDRKVSVAPMMDCTDRHERFFLRCEPRETGERPPVASVLKKGNAEALEHFQK